MSYIAAKKHSFFVPTGDDQHLFAVMNDVCHNGQHLLLSVTSVKAHMPNYDRTCELAIGEHPFITKPSYVYYRKPEVRSAAHISKCVDAKAFMQKEDFEDGVFERILAGIEISDHTPRFALEYMRSL